MAAGEVRAGADLLSDEQTTRSIHDIIVSTISILDPDTYK
jgi:hypothetical protein